MNQACKRRVLGCCATIMHSLNEIGRETAESMCAIVVESLP
jgi:hypothetical protein